LSNFRETFGNFLETVSLVIGQETVSLGMWSLVFVRFLEEFEDTKKTFRNQLTFSGIFFKEVLQSNGIREKS
jgi:hypothetical protein